MLLTPTPADLLLQTVLTGKNKQEGILQNNFFIYYFRYLLDYLPRKPGAIIGTWMENTIAQFLLVHEYWLTHDN